MLKDTVSLALNSISMDNILTLALQTLKDSYFQVTIGYSKGCPKRNGFFASTVCFESLI